MFKQGQIAVKYKTLSDCPHQESNPWNASGLLRTTALADHWAIEIRWERCGNFWLCLSSVVKLIFSLRWCIGQPETINLSNYSNCTIFFVVLKGMQLCVNVGILIRGNDQHSWIWCAYWKDFSHVTKWDTSNCFMFLKLNLPFSLLLFSLIM